MRQSRVVQKRKQIKKNVKNLTQSLVGIKDIQVCKKISIEKKNRKIFGEPIVTQKLE